MLNEAWKNICSNIRAASNTGILMAESHMPWSLPRMHRLVQGCVRDLDVVEVFSGCKSVYQAAQRKNLAAAFFDIIDSEDDDIMTESGMERAVRLVGRVKEDGLVTIASECRTFCGLCCANTGRRKDTPEGTTELAEHGNIMAERAALLFRFADERLVHALMENPDGNFFWSQPVIQSLLEDCSATTAKVARCRFQAAGPKYKKVYRFEGSRSWVANLSRPCKCKKPHATLASSKPVVKADGTVKKSVTGKSQDLKNSGQYPNGLGKLIVNKWLAGKTCSRDGEDPDMDETHLWRNLVKKPEIASETKSMSWKIPLN